jgi:hypothetical protein
MSSEWERVKDLIVAIDARLSAIADGRVKYYVCEYTTTVSITVVMIIPKLEKAAVLRLDVSRLDIMQPSWCGDSIANRFIYTWIDKYKLERDWREVLLNVVFDNPPSWAEDVI